MPFWISPHINPIYLTLYEYNNDRQRCMHTDVFISQRTILNNNYMFATYLANLLHWNRSLCWVTLKELLMLKLDNRLWSVHGQLWNTIAALMGLLNLPTKAVKCQNNWISNMLWNQSTKQFHWTIRFKWYFEKYKEENPQSSVRN